MCSCQLSVGVAAAVGLFMLLLLFMLLSVVGVRVAYLKLETHE